MNVAVFPGSFDPVTLGHMDVLERASRLFERVYVCAMVNGGKHPMFTGEQRLALLAAATERLPNVTAELWTGLLADYAREKGARYLVKGVRNASDFEAEYGMAQINRGLYGELDTVLFAREPGAGAFQLDDGAGDGEIPAASGAIYPPRGCRAYERMG